MKLRLLRGPSSAVCTPGSLWVDDTFFCFTLEDVVRADSVKVYGETAIPAGTYAVTITYSGRFQRPMPHVLQVPGFSGIRIHSGNSAADTHGCILVGYSRRNGSHIARSREAFDALFPEITAALARGEDVSIEIVPAAPEASEPIAA